MLRFIAYSYRWPKRTARVLSNRTDYVLTTVIAFPSVAKRM